MAESLVILTSRRGYEFKPNELRLTGVTLPQVRQALRDAYQFDVVQIAQPAPTFGAVSNTFPPGLICDNGFTMAQGELVPIRFLHFEPLRIVVDYVGPTTVADQILQRVREICDEIQLADKSKIIGQVDRVRNYSEISFNLKNDFSDLLGREISEFVPGLLQRDRKNVKTVPTAVEFSSIKSSDGQPPQIIAQYSLQIRGGSDPSQNTYFSAGDVAVDDHIAWLEKFEKFMA